MLKQLFSMSIIAGTLTLSGCKSGNTSSVSDVPPPSSSGAITASPEFTAGGPQPVALKSNTPTTYNAAYNTTPDSYTLGAPVPAPTGPVAQPLGGAGGNYVVRQGDTLWSISRAHYGTGQRWKDIVTANPGLTAERLPVGRAIMLP